MSDPNTPAERRLRNARNTADHFMVGQETVVRWRNQGYIRAYKLDGSRVMLYDLDEVERAFKVHGPTKMRDGRRRGRGRVVRVITAERVDE